LFHEFLNFLKTFGIWGLVIHSFIDAVIFPIPAFFTQVSLSVLQPHAALWLATAGFAACLAGTPFGYMIGRFLGSKLLDKILKRKWIDAATAMFQKHGETAILIGAFTPIPFKVFTILSGSFAYPLWKLIGYAFIGRAVKFYVVGILFYIYGRAAEGMVKEVSYYVAAGAIALIALFLVIRKRWRKKKRSQPAVQPQPLDSVAPNETFAPGDQ
jgi:membrane protein YqaA with SNARE-associated domain